MGRQASTDKAKQKKALPFSRSKEYAHPDVPGQWADFTVIMVQPPIQIAVLHVLVNDHPDDGWTQQLFGSKYCQCGSIMSRLN